MRRPFLIALLALGTVGGFTSGFRSMHRWRHGGGDCGRWSQRYDGRYGYGDDSELRNSARESDVKVAAPAPAPAPVAAPAPAPQAPAQPLVVIISIQSSAPAPATQVLPIQGIPIQVAPYGVPVQVAPGQIIPQVAPAPAATPAPAPAH